MNIDDIDITNYYNLVNPIKELIKNKQYEAAENYLLKIVNVLESESKTNGEGVASGYYFELAKIYRKQKMKEKEGEIIHRYLISHKSGGSLSIKLFERYIKLIDCKKIENLKDSLYKEYLGNTKDVPLKRKNVECSVCGIKVKMFVPRNCTIFRGTCPRCYESNLFEIQ